MTTISVLRHEIQQIFNRLLSIFQCNKAIKWKYCINIVHIYPISENLDGAISNRGCKFIMIIIIIILPPSGIIYINTQPWASYISTLLLIGVMKSLLNVFGWLSVGSVISLSLCCYLDEINKYKRYLIKCSGSPCDIEALVGVGSHTRQPRNILSILGIIEELAQFIGENASHLSIRRVRGGWSVLVRKPQIEHCQYCHH